ncbi:MAG: SH3 domain-containing protein [Lachnospiraceae bacterium]|nr:SH3 domain-containing protein [Lachnospiraceae bacterium]
MTKVSRLKDKSLEDVTGGAERTINNSASGFAYIRKDPDIKSRIIAKAYNGQIVSTTGKTEEKDGVIWYQINLIGEYSYGWIMGQLIGF